MYIASTTRNMDLTRFPNETLTSIAEQCDSVQQLDLFACTSTRLNVIFEREKWRENGSELCEVLHVIPCVWKKENSPSTCSNCEEDKGVQACFGVWVTSRTSIII